MKETCDSCKRYKWVDFLVADRVWKRIMGSHDAGVLCLNCFVEKANELEVTLKLEDFQDVCIYNPGDLEGNIQSLKIYEGTT